MSDKRGGKKHYKNKKKPNPNASDRSSVPCASTSTEPSYSLPFSREALRKQIEELCLSDVNLILNVKPPQVNFKHHEKLYNDVVSLSNSSPEDELPCIKDSKPRAPIVSEKDPVPLIQDFPGYELPPEYTFNQIVKPKVSNSDYIPDGHSIYRSRQEWIKLQLGI